MTHAHPSKPVQTFSLLVTLGNVLCIIAEASEIHPSERLQIFWAVVKSEEVHLNVDLSRSEAKVIPLARQTAQFEI
jgi:hypothetical protein